MKSTLTCVCTLTLLLLLSACPVGMDYPLGEPGSEPIDNRLIGTWLTDSSQAVVAVTVTKHDETSYDVNVIQQGELYALESTTFRGFVTHLAGYSFLYLEDANPLKYFLYEYSVTSGGAVITHDVSLMEGGVDAVTSTESYREEVSASLKMEGCLSEEAIWLRQ